MMLHRAIVCVFKRHDWEQVAADTWSCRRCHAVTRLAPTVEAVWRMMDLTVDWAAYREAKKEGPGEKRR